MLNQHLLKLRADYAQLEQKMAALKLEHEQLSDSHAILENTSATQIKDLNKSLATRTSDLSRARKDIDQVWAGRMPRPHLIPLRWPAPERLGPGQRASGRSRRAQQENQA